MAHLSGRGGGRFTGAAAVAGCRGLVSLSFSRLGSRPYARRQQTQDRTAGLCQHLSDRDPWHRGDDRPRPRRRRRRHSMQIDRPRRPRFLRIGVGLCVVNDPFPRSSLADYLCGGQWEREK